MDENRTDTPEQVIEFAPKGGPRSDGTPVDQARVRVAYDHPIGPVEKCRAERHRDLTLILWRVW
jgi:hypothetical protein